MRWPIRSQLLIPLFLLLVGVAGMSLWMAAASAARARQEIETRVRNVAHLLSEPPQFPLVASVLEKMKRLSGADYLLVGGDGPAATTLAVEPAEPPPAEAVADDWQTVRLGPRIEVAGRAYLCSGIRLKPPRTGTTLYILYPETQWRDAWWEAARPMLTLGGSVGLASVALALALGKQLGGRLGELERRTRLIAAGDFSPMPLPRRDDEIRDLARAINEMAQRLAQLQQAVQRTERFRLLGQVGGGLAHQLRNGLTGARLAVQLYLRESTAGTDTAGLDVALRQLTLLETNLTRFLDLGRDGAPRRERCPLTALVHEAVELLRPRCRHAGIDLRWQTPPAAYETLGDPGRLEQLVVNLLGNAVEAAGPGGWVEVVLKGKDQLLVLEVLDSGPGPAADVGDRLFEPFVTTRPEGVGLGLAVARQVAEAHGGRVCWDRRGQSTCFRVELPGIESPVGEG